MPKFNTMLDVAFSVDHDFENDQNLLDSPEGIKLVIQALEKRVQYLKDNPQEAAGAFGVCDTYENIQ